jgi:hypothetical protein
MAEPTMSTAEQTQHDVKLTTSRKKKMKKLKKIIKEKRTLQNYAEMIILLKNL